MVHTKHLKITVHTQTPIVSFQFHCGGVSTEPNDRNSVIFSDINVCIISASFPQREVDVSLKWSTCKIAKMDQISQIKRPPLAILFHLVLIRVVWRRPGKEEQTT